MSRTTTDKMAEFFDKLSGEKFAYVKKKQYLCTMKEELKKYLESQEQLNKQTIRMRELGMKLAITLIISGLVGIVIAAILI